MAKQSKHRSPGPIIAPGSTIRFEEPRSQRQPKNPLIGPPDVHPVSGFLDFLREYSVVSLAIAFVIGLQSQVLVKQLLASFIDPLSELLFGQVLSTRTFTMEFHGRSVDFAWGSFAYSLLDFIFVLGAIYVIVKVLKLDKLNKPKKKVNKDDLEAKD
jgi:large conductance mechanosensitive channel